MSGLMLRATRQPTIPCAITKDQGGIFTPPLEPGERIAAAIAPSSNAAGKRIRSRSKTKTSDVR